jgi:hypothetical protein
MEAPSPDAQRHGAALAPEKGTSAELHERLAPRARGGVRGGLASPRQGLGVQIVDLASIALLAIALRGLTLSISVIDVDEGAFVLAARELMLGHLPYLTFWDHKPLGSTVLIAAAMTAFGQSIETARVLALACVIATAWSLHAIAFKVLSDRLTALLAASLYVAFSTRLLGLGLMNEILLAPFTAVGVLLLLSAPERRGGSGPVLTFAAAGLSFGIATWIKYVPALPAALVGGFVLSAVLLRPNGGIPRVLALGAVFAAGLLLPSAGSVLLYWWFGVLDEFYHANFGFAQQYMEFVEHPVGALLVRARWASLALVQIWPLVALTAAAFLPSAFRFFRDGGRRWGCAVVGVWLAGELLALCAQMKFYDYQFLATLPPMSVVAAASVRFHASRLAVPSKAMAAAVLAAAFIAFVPVAHHLRDTAAALLRPDVPREIARVLAREMARDDLVYVVNYEPIIYFLAGAPLPTRYAFPMHLAGRRTFMDTDVTTERRRVLESRPKYIVINEGWRDNTVLWDPQAMLPVEEVLRQDYQPRAEWALHESLGVIRLFVRRG